MRALTFVLFLLSANAFASPAHMIEVRGTINPGSASFILDALKAAEDAKAEALLLRLDTPGGLLASTRTIIQGISESSVPVILWISPGGASATSAGALIAMACHVVAMAPGTNIGAAHPVGGQGEEIKGPMGEKATNDTAALARSLAALRGRNSEAAELIVTKSRSFSAQEAVKEGVADFVAGDIEAILKQASGRKIQLERPKREITLSLAATPESSLVKHEMNLKQKFLHFVADPNVSTMLLTLAGIALWAEVSSGFSSIAAGVVGLFCLVLALVSMQTLPINVGGALMMVFGFLLLIVEAFVTSYGLLSVAALAAFFIGGLFLIDPSEGSMRVSIPLLISIIAASGTILLTVGYLLAREKRRKKNPSEPMLHAEAKVQTVDASGRHGTALVNGELWNFETTEPVSAGDLCRVHSVRGLKIHLERKK